MKKSAIFYDVLYRASAVMTSSIVFAAVLFSFFLRVVPMRGSYMGDTVPNGSIMVISPLFDRAHEGGVYVFTSKDGAKQLCSRVMATEGMWIRVDKDTGRAAVGKTMDKMTAKEEKEARYGKNENIKDMNVYPILVPEGCVFGLADNRASMRDSRNAMTGFLDERSVLGKLVFVIK